MPIDHTTESHLSKDELLEILNDIDTEQHHDRSKTAGPPSENPT